MKSLDTKRVRDAWGLFFTLGVIMLNYPFIHIFNKETPIFGIPLLVLYFLIGWPFSIVVVYFFTRHLGAEDTSPPLDDRKGKTDV